MRVFTENMGSPEAPGLHSSSISVTDSSAKISNGLRTRGSRLTKLMSDISLNYTHNIFFPGPTSEVTGPKRILNPYVLVTINHL